MSLLNMDLPDVTRSSHLVETVVFVDGLGGCGKTLFSPIISALPRVELMTYAYEIEHICALYFLNKITQDAACTMIRLLADLQLYNTMMSRETNVRPSDLSSIWHDARPWRYIRRLLQKGDETIPERIAKEKPILQLTTHELCSMNEPIFSALGKRVVFIEIVRHPLYMLKQQTLNMEGFRSNQERDFSIRIRYENQEVPYFTRGWEKLFLSSNAIDRAIYYIQKLTATTEETRAKLIPQFGNQIIVIPFERFVLDPWPYMEIITNRLEVAMTPLTRRVIKKQNVPRKKYAEGIKRSIYNRCGWEPAEKGTSEIQEFAKRRQFAVEKGASAEALNILDTLSAQYERQYLGGEISK